MFKIVRHSQHDTVIKQVLLRWCNNWSSSAQTAIWPHKIEFPVELVNWYSTLNMQEVVISKSKVKFCSTDVGSLDSKNPAIPIGLLQNCWMPNQWHESTFLNLYT